MEFPEASPPAATPPPVSDASDLPDPSDLSDPSDVSDRLEAALAAGTLAAIATGGALVGLGWREGEAGRLFRLAGRALLERAGVPSASTPLTAVALGYVHHLLVASAWGAVLALCVLPWRGPWRVAAALGAAAAYGWLAPVWVPVPWRIGLAVTDAPGAAVTIAASLAVALLAGGWLARGVRADHPGGGSAR